MNSNNFTDDFNTKMLTPDLSKKQIEELHEDALRLYKEYLDKDSYNFISCPTDISLDFEYLVKEYYSIEKLTKSSKLLYKAYDYTFTALETVWLSKFFHSSEVCCHTSKSMINLIFYVNFSFMHIFVVLGLCLLILNS